MATPPASPAADRVPARDRLLAGLARALEDRRLSDVTMNDIVRHARMSKRTFYEHFTDKEECFLALYNGVCDALDARLRRAVDRDLPIEAQVRVIAQRYVESLAAAPAITRAALSDIIGGGDACLAARRAQHEEFAKGLREAFAHARPIDQQMAAALVGGINELVLRQIDLGKGDQLLELVDPVHDLVLAVVQGPARPGLEA